MYQVHFAIPLKGSQNQNRLRLHFCAKLLNVFLVLQCFLLLSADQSREILRDVSIGGWFASRCSSNLTWLIESDSLRTWSYCTCQSTCNSEASIATSPSTCAGSWICRLLAHRLANKAVQMSGASDSKQAVFSFCLWDNSGEPGRKSFAKQLDCQI